MGRTKVKMWPFPLPGMITECRNKTTMSIKKTMETNVVNAVIWIINIDKS